MNLTFHFKQRSQVNHLIQCASIRIVLNSLNFCLYWLGLYIAVERVLIEYSFVSLYDSRRRSLVSSVLLFILIPLANLLPILFGRRGYTYTSSNFCVLNFTPVGYTRYLVFDCINHIGIPLALAMAGVVIFKHLIKHRLTLVHGESFCSSLILIASKHYDLFLPPGVYCLLTGPSFIFDKLMNCVQAELIAVFPAQTAMELLSDSALALSFFIYVYLSKVYLHEFWQTSPCGRFLVYVKKCFINSCKDEMIVAGGERQL